VAAAIHSFELLDGTTMTSLATSESRDLNPDGVMPGGRLPAWVVTHWETILYGLLFALAVFTRFYDLGARAISHDESLHMLYSYKLYNGEGYVHDPMMHGPFLFEINALLFFLFGDNNYVGRVGVALFGVALVMLPIWFRPWLGRVGALATAAMILLSPAITHYSRHLRHDIFNEVFTLLMFAALFQCLLAWRRGESARLRRWFFVGAVSVVLSLTVMEIAYIHGFIGFTFVVMLALTERMSVAGRRRLFWIGLGLGVLVGGVVLWLAIGNAGVAPLEQAPGLARQAVGGLGSWIESLSDTATPGSGVKVVWKILHLVVLATGLFVGVATVGLSVTDRIQKGEGRAAVMAEQVLLPTARSVAWRDLGIAVLVGAIIFVVLYTTFFTNPYGIVSGTWGGVSYWLSQQDVQRGGQPWYYYLLLLPLYEFLPLIVGLGGGVWYLVRRLRVTARMAAGRLDAEAVDTAASTVLDNYFVGFAVYWAFLALLIYSWAGEKMPWLTVHMSLPLIFLAGWTIERVVCGLRGRWGHIWRSGGAVYVLLLPLVIAALAALLSARPFAGQSLMQLRDTGQWLGAVVVLAILAYAVVHYARRMGGAVAGRVAFVVAVVILGLLTARSSWMVSFINYDNVSEYLFYAHGAPDVTVAMKQIEDISRRTVGDKLIKVAYDNESTWPLEWYFREYPNRAYYGDSPSRQQMDAPIVIVGSPNESKVTPYLGDNYVRFDYRLVWWPLETYKEQTPTKIWNTYIAPDASGDDTLQQAAWDRIARNRQELWDFLLYHRHATPKNNWPYVHRFYMYVRKDVLNQLWDYHTGPAAANLPTERYAAAKQELRALRSIGGQGLGAGQFTSPRAVAIGADGTWYVADSGNQRIQVLDADGVTVRMWGSAGSGPGQFQEPWGIAVNQKLGRVYVSDTWNHRVQVFDLEGNYLKEWGHFADTKGVAEVEPGGFWGPRDIALDAAGNVYVADTGNKRIQKFDANGEFIAQWGGAGVIPGRFDEPTSLDITADGVIYVADAWNRRVQTFSAALKPLGEWPVDSWTSESVVNKPFVRVSPAGDVYVSDPERYRILVFDREGEFRMTFGQYGADTASFALPLGMAFTPDGHLVVVDSDNHRLLEFAPPSLAGARP
jgi:uncharacterized protein (TIGR03663 family)